MFCLSPSPGLPVYNTQYHSVCKVFFENNLRFLKTYENNVDLIGAFSLYFFGGFCYKKKWTVKRGGLDGQSRATHNK